jgi:predicted alpha/beta superfamily hydrolase
MLKSTIVLPFLLLSSVAMAQQTIHMEIKSLPEHHPSGSDIYIAGSFNGWNAQDSKYRLNKDAQGVYYIDLTLAEGSYEYKFTRGGWDKGECKKNGGMSGNRILKVPADASVTINIEEWADRFPAKPKVSTASKNVKVIDTAFLIPQLKRTRRVWVYLPEGYSKASTTRYPVLYMHDGQNVFDDATSYSGEWALDEFLDSTTSKKCIVVAIDNGGAKRLNEYNPYDNERFGKGEGNQYVDFLVKTLKPFIDKKYRTLKDKNSTWIAGSSMGGLISMYAVLKYPDVFGGVGVFSPAFWISGAGIYDDIRKMGKNVNARIYFYGGQMEGESMVPDMIKAHDEMKKVSASKMTTVVKGDGKHNERAWREEFPWFYRWLVK